MVAATRSSGSSSSSSSRSLSSRIRRNLPCFFGSEMEQVVTNPRSVLFICLGNICRSPIAEAVFRKVAQDRGVLDKWTIDSAATANYHVGEPADNRAEACLRRHEISSNHIVRQVKTEDFQNFAYILVMDHENLKNLQKFAPKTTTCKTELLGQYDPQSQLFIEDPYYGSDSDFDVVYEQCLRSCRAFIDQVEKTAVTEVHRK